MNDYKIECTAFRKTLLISALLALCLVVGVSTTFAGSATLTGTLTPGDPTMPVVFISPPNCTAQGVSPVLYHVYAFTVDASGTHNFSQTSPDGFASLYLFEGSFNPAAAFPDCIAADNSGNPVSFSASLTAGTQYFAVPFDDTFAQAGGDYTLSIDGPGNILFAGAACAYPLPAGTVVYDVPAGAPAFFEPRLDTQVNFNLPAGTWKIMEFSGDFAKVWIACQAQPIWIPRNAVGAAVG